MRPMARSSSAGNERGSPAASASATRAAKVSAAAATSVADKEGGTSRGRSGSTVDRSQSSGSSVPVVVRDVDVKTSAEATSKRAASTSSAASTPGRRSRKVDKSSPASTPKITKSSVGVKAKVSPKKVVSVSLRGDKTTGSSKSTPTSDQVGKENAKLKKSAGKSSKVASLAVAGGQLSDLEGVKPVILKIAPGVEDGQVVVAVSDKVGGRKSKSSTTPAAAAVATTTSPVANTFLGSVLKTDLGEILRRSCRERKSNSRFSDDGTTTTSTSPTTSTTVSPKSKSTSSPAGIGTSVDENAERLGSVRLKLKKEQSSQSAATSTNSRRGTAARREVKKDFARTVPASTDEETDNAAVVVVPKTSRSSRKSIGNSPNKTPLVADLDKEDVESAPLGRSARKGVPNRLALVDVDVDAAPISRSARKSLPGRFEQTRKKMLQRKVLPNSERARKSMPSHADSISVPPPIVRLHRQNDETRMVTDRDAPSTSALTSGATFKVTLVSRTVRSSAEASSDRLDSDSPVEGGNRNQQQQQRPKRRHFKGGTYQLSLKRSAKKKRPGLIVAGGVMHASNQEDLESISTEASNLTETDADEATADEQQEPLKRDDEEVEEPAGNGTTAEDSAEDLCITEPTKSAASTAIVARSCSPQEVPSYSPGIPEAAKLHEAPRSSAAKLARLVRPTVVLARRKNAKGGGGVASSELSADRGGPSVVVGRTEPPVVPDIGLLVGDRRHGMRVDDLLELQGNPVSNKENGLWRGTKRKTRDEDEISSTVSSVSNVSLDSKLSRDGPATPISSPPSKKTQMCSEPRRITSITVHQDDKNCGLLTCTCRTTYGIHLTRARIGSCCQGIDCIDKRLIGCVNTVSSPEVYRPSVRIPFLSLCEVHRQRLRLHQCCPGCGLFCTQGCFVQCRADPKNAVVHHAHVECMSMRDGVRACPHCSSSVALQEVTLELNAPRSPTLINVALQRKRKEPGARMAFTRGNENVVSPDPSQLAPSMAVTISDSGKEISSAGLPLGPDRSHLETLLANNVQTDKSPNSGQRFTTKNMQLATKAADMEKVLQMLMSGFDPNTKFEDQDNCSIVHLAAAVGNLVLVHLLVQAGACLDSMDNNLQTPIMLSIENNFPLVSLYLIKAGVQLDARGEDGMTALHLAAKAGQLDVCRTILDTGKVNANILDDGGWTSLVWAAEYRHVDVVKFLLERGCDPNLRDNEHNIALHWSAFSGSLEICEIFLNQGCNLNSINEHGDTPLHIAARQDKYDCVMLFLARNADVDILNKEDETPLMCCPVAQSQTWLALSMTKHMKKISESRTTRSERIVHQDISRGKEQNPIQCVNCFDDEPAPSDFIYIHDNCETSPISMDRSIASLQCCQCEDDCSSPNCTCGSLSLKCWYDKEGKLINEFNLLDPPMIFECNRACRCFTSCNNRTVQHGITCRLQLFRTKVKGWGVRALREIPRGTFICEYVGELISDMEADQRQDDSYLFDLDNRDGETYCIDARRYGNISRFINHLCEPNLVPVKIFIDYQDLRFPRIALFSSRTIQANEELGFDYGDKFWVIKCKDFTCACLADKCKYSDATIGETLANYHCITRPTDVAVP